MTNDALVKRNDVPLAAVVDDEVVMFDPERGAYFSLGEVGSRVWELIEQPVSIDQMCDVLVQEYEIDREACRAEVVAFLDQLDGAGLLAPTD